LGESLGKRKRRITDKYREGREQNNLGGLAQASFEETGP